MINFKHLLFACAFVITVMFSGNMQAQDFEVAPVALSFSLEPGEVESKSIRVTNYSAKEYSFVLELFDEGFEGEDLKRFLPAGSTKNSIAEWVNINPTFFKLKPNETKQIEITLTVPSNNYETKWGILAVRTADERSEINADKTLGTGITVSPRIKVTLIQSPKSNNKFRGEIVEFVKLPDDALGKNKFKVVVENVGGKLITPKVYLLIADINTGKEIKEKGTEATLMPGQRKTLELTTSTVLPKGEYAVAAVLDYGGNAPLEVVQMMITR